MKIGVYNYYKVHNVGGRMLLDPSVSDGGDDTNYPHVLLARTLKDIGHTVETIQMNGPEDYDRIVFFEFPESKRTGTPDKLLKRLIKNGFKEMYLVCMETEAIKPNNWVIANHRYFKKIFTWHDDFIDNKRYFRVHSTSHRREERVDFDLGRKDKMCTLIARNKFSSHPSELYSERRKAIRWFEENHPEDFDLYGVGWDRYLGGMLRPINAVDGCLRRLGDAVSGYHERDNLFHRSAKVGKMLYPLIHRGRVEYPSYRGPVASTREVLKKYKFAICFENSSFPGWITERIFDCFLAGCVPIYLGDSNITTRIPSDTFVDMRQFKSYACLYHGIKQIDNEKYLGYINAVRAFMDSDRNYRFTAECFAKTICKEILND